MSKEQIEKLKNMLEVATEQGIDIYQGDRRVTAEDIINSSYVNEANNYMPDFLVKNESGEIKEIWYGEVRKI